MIWAKRAKAGVKVTMTRQLERCRARAAYQPAFTSMIARLRLPRHDQPVDARSTRADFSLALRFMKEKLQFQYHDKPYRL